MSIDIKDPGDKSENVAVYLRKALRPQTLPADAAAPSALGISADAELVEVPIYSRDAADEQLNSLNVPNISRYRRYDVRNRGYGADPELSAATNINAIQKAIQDGHDDGRAEVFVPYVGSGLYKIGASTDTTSLRTIASGPVYVDAPASSKVSLLLKPGVHLISDDGVVIENQDPTRDCLGIYMMRGGGIHGGHFKSVWDVAAPVGAGHGIFTYVATNANDDPMQDFVIEDVEVSHVPSYCFGLQQGHFENVTLRRIYGHDCGADVVDWKVRPKLDGTPAINNVIDGLRGERWGRRAGIIASALLDVRGQVFARNIKGREAAYGSQNNVGIRLSAGINFGPNIDLRQSSKRAIVKDFDLDAGDPSIAGTEGLVLLDSGGMAVDGYVNNFDKGVSVTNSSSGWGSNDLAVVDNVQVEAARYRSFDIVSDRCSVVKCSASGQIERFESPRGNLTAGQTVYVSPRPFDPAVVIALVNDVAVAATVGGTNTMTLAAGVLATDVVKIVSPSPEGVNLTGKYVEVDVRVLHVTTPLVADGVPAATMRGVGVKDDTTSWIGTTATASGVAEDIRGPAANYERSISAKGDAGVELRSNGHRALRAYNASPNASNFAEISGSPTGAAVALSAQGSDANIEIEVKAKADAGVALRSNGQRALRGYNSDPASTNFVQISGSASGLAVSQSAQGTDINITYSVLDKGNGGVDIRSNAARALRLINDAPGAANFWQMKGSQAGSDLNISAVGTDAVIGMKAQPKGGGIFAVDAPLKLKAYTVATKPSAASSTQCVIYISDGAGGKRLAVCNGTDWLWPDGTIVS